MPFTVSDQLHRNVSRFEAVANRGRKVVTGRVAAIDPRGVVAALEAGNLAAAMAAFGDEIIADLGRTGAMQAAIESGARSAEGVLLTAARSRQRARRS